jgi:hypothetical protein
MPNASVAPSPAFAIPARTWAPLGGAVLGLTIAVLAGVISLRAGLDSIVILQDQAIGLAHLVAGTIAWRR